MQLDRCFANQDQLSRKANVITRRIDGPELMRILRLDATVVRYDLAELNGFPLFAVANLNPELRQNEVPVDIAARTSTRQRCVGKCFKSNASHQLAGDRTFYRVGLALRVFT